MESKYLMFVDGQRVSYQGNAASIENAQAAAVRLQERLKKGTIQAIYIKNPRWTID